MGIGHASVAHLPLTVRFRLDKRGGGIVTCRLSRPAGELPRVEPFVAGALNECGWDGHDDPGAGCARCGGSSFCHDQWWGGGCHIPCGPAGDAYAVAAEVEDALERGDVAAIALALHKPQEGVSLDFIPAAGRIDVILPCDPNSAFRTIPVPPAARDRLQAAVDAATPTE